MTRPCAGLSSVLTALVILGSSPAAWPACNVIPDPKDQFGTGPNPSPEAKALATAILEENARFNDALPHKGALGRIDRVMLTAARPGPIRVVADGLCVPDRLLPPFDVTSTDDLVAALIVRGKQGQQRALVVGAACRDIKMPETSRRVLVDCAKGGIALDDDLPQGFTLDIPFDPAAEPAGSVRVTVFRAATADAAAHTLAQLAGTDCEALCAEGAQVAGLGVCIDDIFTPTGLLQSQIVYGTQDMVKCEVRTTPITWNEFKTQCHNGNGSSGLPQCDETPAVLNMWEDTCHGVYVPFKWGALLSSGTSKYERQVQGQTVLSQRPVLPPGSTEPRLWIPGPEFVGTLSETDVTGTQPGFVTDPRRAQLDVFFPSGIEFGIKGIADKDQSIVHVVPRLAVSIVCTDGPDEACMGVPTVPGVDDSRCACRDKYAPDCTCETDTPARFFQCSTSGMPCTRHSHCNPGDLCKEQPTCQPEGTVWKKVGANPVGPKGCWDDKHCKNETGATQCGYLLFDMHAIRGTTGDLVLDAKLEGMDPGKRRGRCWKKGVAGAPKECTNASGPPVCNPATEGHCTEYVLEALGGTKLP